MIISRIRTTVISMTILATALVSTAAMAAQPQAEVISQSCTDAIHSTNPTLVSLRPVQPNSKLPIAAPGGGSTEKKTCETTHAPATNPQGVNGSNRCTTCTYSSSGHVSVNCIFIKPK
ncbi:hypothetical protein [Nostoc sp. UHCC 0870]|uniref:hypothetical protein n=1 Tax=Nostoc sp. UHCC 0870 TaxID=2914041 RepID=UPI001EDE618F|nr:hypothetical protein [Nostoc sp. UHCC 0870]UKP00266.1 hypothetical protein L6494_11445 [Nostoc sp. UHCC 0870]